MVKHSSGAPRRKKYVAKMRYVDDLNKEISDVCKGLSQRQGNGCSTGAPRQKPYLEVTAVSSSGKNIARVDFVAALVG